MTIGFHSGNPRFRQFVYMRQELIALGQAGNVAGLSLVLLRMGAFVGAGRGAGALADAPPASNFVYRACGAWAYRLIGTARALLPDNPNTSAKRTEDNDPD